MVTEEEWSGEVARSARFRLLSPVIALGAFGLVFIPCMMAGQALARGINADLVTVGILLGFMFPLAFVLVALGERQQRRTDEKVRNLNAELSSAVSDADRLNALPLVSSALRAGFGIGFVDSDPDLNALRPLPEFQRLVSAAHALHARTK